MTVAIGELTVAPAEPPPQPEPGHQEDETDVQDEVRRVIARERRHAERLVAT
jgi:hypothetical protein